MRTQALPTPPLQPEQADLLTIFLADLEQVHGRDRAEAAAAMLGLDVVVASEPEELRGIRTFTSDWLRQRGVAVPAL
jgi:hypothetical protein